MDYAACEGGCLCGAIRYRVTGAARSSSVCHCRSCRLASGAPSVAWFVVENRQFTFLRGEPSTFRSSPPVERSFCGRCGTPLTYRHDDDPDAVEITTATLDDPERFAPTKEIWLQQKLSWAASDARVEHHARSGDDGDENTGA
jgi:hypothetical protein